MSTVSTISEKLDRHLEIIPREISEGSVIPFLGAGVNLCERPKKPDKPDELIDWVEGKDLPSGRELTEYLARKFAYPGTELKELLRVSQFAMVTNGAGPLYRDLRSIFNRDTYPVTKLHRFLAGLPGTLRSKGYTKQRKFLIVTTNYDDVLERAFIEKSEPFDLIAYIAQGEKGDRGRFWHRPPWGNDYVMIQKPNEYEGLMKDLKGDDRDSWNVILKIHGAVHRSDWQRDSYVITEDDYIDYLAQNSIESQLPASLLDALKRSHYLFLGYSLNDWNLRVMLRRIWESGVLPWVSWAVDVKSKPLEERFWNKRNVEFITAALLDYIAELDRRIQALPNSGSDA